MSDDATYKALRTMPVSIARQAVVDSGQFGGIEGPFFSDDGVTWREFWLPGGEGAHPALAKVTIWRSGVERGRTVVVSWDEYASRDEDSEHWRTMWRQQPMTMFGAAAERQGYWVLFGDILEPLAKVSAEPPAELPDVQTLRERREQRRAVGRDWAAEVEAAVSQADVEALYAEARHAKALVGDAGDELQAKFSRRLAALAEQVEPSAEEPVTVDPETAAKLADLRDNLTAAPERPKPGPPKLQGKDRPRSRRPR